MGAIEPGTTAGARPVLAAPRPPEGQLPLWQFMRGLRDSSIATYRAEAYSADILERHLFWGRTFFVNEPNAIKHILLDNAANYAKTEITRRLLEPGLGRGLLTSEGDTWRRHRRIMAPSFDHRSIVAYAPLMTEIAEDLAAQWDTLPAGGEVDVAAASVHAALNIISRTMFSSDSDEIVDIVERGVGRSQSPLPPGLVDLLELPQWLSRLTSWRRPERIFSEFDKMIDLLLTARGPPGGGEAQPKDLLARFPA